MLSAFVEVGIDVFKLDFNIPYFFDKFDTEISILKKVIFMDFLIFSMT